MLLKQLIPAPAIVVRAGYHVTAKEQTMATKKLKNQPANGWPKITQGSHLTVKTFEDGRTELVWDDEALLRDVQEAIASVQNSAVVAEKPKRKKKAS